MQPSHVLQRCTGRAPGTKGAPEWRQMLRCAAFEGAARAVRVLAGMHVEANVRKPITYNAAYDVYL